MSAKNTKIFKINNIDKDIDKIQQVAEIITNGGVVAIPTETVYGLAGNALNPIAVKKIFEAKGRPQDNPLIVHIHDVEQAEKYAKNIPDNYYKLAEKFCPGPLTIILDKKDIIPMETSGGLDSVGLRIPNHAIAKEIIRLSGVPIAAPSANLSGKPSPTCAKHCIEDLMGKIDAIVDGGECGVGVESTVLSLATHIPTIFRPGAVTQDQIQDVIGDILIDNAVEHKMQEGEKPLSPGMKYRHYSPLAEVIILKGSNKNYADYVNNHQHQGVYAMCFREDVELVKIPYLVYGGENQQSQQAKLLFDILREADRLK